MTTLNSTMIVFCLDWNDVECRTKRGINETIFISREPYVPQERGKKKLKTEPKSRNVKKTRPALRNKQGCMKDGEKIRDTLEIQEQFVCDKTVERTTS